jgi:hypothetical protein
MAEVPDCWMYDDGMIEGNAVIQQDGGAGLPSRVDVRRWFAASTISFDSVTTVVGANVLTWTYDPAATLMMTAKLNGIDPLASLADVLSRIADLPQSRLQELLPRHWVAETERREMAA